MSRFLSSTSSFGYGGRYGHAPKAVFINDKASFCEDEAGLPPAGTGGGLSRSSSVGGDEAAILKSYEDDTLVLYKNTDALERLSSTSWNADAQDTALVTMPSPSVLEREISWNPSRIFQPQQPQLGEHETLIEAADAIGLGEFVHAEGGVTEADVACSSSVWGADGDADALLEDLIPQLPLVPAIPLPPSADAAADGDAGVLMEVTPTKPVRRSGRPSKPVRVAAETPVVVPRIKSKSAGRHKSSSSRHAHAPAKPLLLAKPVAATATVAVAPSSGSAAGRAGRLEHKLKWQGAPRPPDGKYQGQTIVTAGCVQVWDPTFRSDGGSWIHPRVQPAAIVVSPEVYAARETDPTYDEAAAENRKAAMARLRAKRACGRVNGPPISHYRDRGEAAGGRTRVGGRFVSENKTVFVSQEQLKKNKKNKKKGSRSS